jgi:hypothetical protein
MMNRGATRTKVGGCAKRRFDLSSYRACTYFWRWNNRKFFSAVSLSTGTSFKIGAGVIAKTQPVQDSQPYRHTSIQVKSRRWTNRYDLRGIAFFAPTVKSDWTYSLALV